MLYVVLFGHSDLRAAVVLNDVVLPTEAAHPALQNGKGLLMKIEHTNRPDNASGWDTKYRIKQTSVTEKGKQGKVRLPHRADLLDSLVSSHQNGPLWKEMEPIIFECSLRELMKQSIQLSFLDRARPDAAPLAKGELLLRTFLVAVRGQPRQQTTVHILYFCVHQSLSTSHTRQLCACFIHIYGH